MNAGLRCFWLLLLGFSALAANGQPGLWSSAGAGAAGTARAQAGQQGEFWSLFGNPAGMIGIEGLTVGTHAEQRFAMNEFTAAQAGALLGLGETQAIGVRAAWMGLGNYGEGRYGLTYAIEPLKGFRIGSGVSWYQMTIPGLGNGNSLYVDAGIHVDITDDLALGAFAVNLSQASLRQLGESSPLPTLLQAGIAYKASEQVTLLADVSQELGFRPGLRGGLEYRPGDRLTFRMGARSQPAGVSGGIGLRLDRLHFDFATEYQPLLGLTPHLALRYALASQPD